MQGKGFPPRMREQIYADTYQSPVGLIYLVFHGPDLAELRFDNPHLRHGHAPEAIIRELDEYFRGERVEFTQSIRFIEGTEFEQSVWLALREIPYGETRSYKWLAEAIGRPKSSRAVGQALSKNPIPIVLPCHRIIESCGRLGGYSGGEDIKRRLLQLEFYTEK